MSSCSKDRFPKVYFFAFVLMTLLAIPSVRQCVSQFFEDRLLSLFKGGKARMAVLPAIRHRAARKMILKSVLI